MLNKTNGARASRPVQIARSLGLLLILLFMIWSTSRAGFASLLSAFAARTNRLPASSAAVSLSPRNPEVHYVRAAVLEASNDSANAAAEYEQAVLLRPDDYVLWLSLAQARESNGDQNGAVSAATYAVQLAPHYAQPHWQLGNLLVRAGRREEGFSELRLAGASNPTLLPVIIDLAWQLSKGDVQYVRQAVQPNTPDVYIALAEYFKKRGKMSEAVGLIRDAGSAGEDYRRRYTDEFISAKRFQDAFALWSIAHPAAPGLMSVVVDRGFEVESDLDEPGFGWRAKKTPSMVLALDDANPNEGKLSLRIEFKGESEPGSPIITQLIMVTPNAHYQLHFAARTEEIVSGGLPGVTILDAGSGQALGQSGAFPLATNGWRDYAVAFTALETTATIQIVLGRERCSRSPCPIFGRLWLDNFSLKKI